MLIFFTNRRRWTGNYALWHMLLFGDAFGPAYMLFFGVFASNYAFFLGGQLKKMLSTGNYATLWSFPAFTAVLCSTHACMQSTLSVCIQQHDPETYLKT